MRTFKSLGSRLEVSKESKASILYTLQVSNMQCTGNLTKNNFLALLFFLKYEIQ